MLFLDLISDSALQGPPHFRKHLLCFAVVKIFIVVHVWIFTFRSAHSSASGLSSKGTQFASL